MKKIIAWSGILVLTIALCGGLMASDACAGAGASKFGASTLRNFRAEIEAFESTYGSSGEVTLNREDGSFGKAVELLFDVVRNTDYVKYVESILRWKIAPGMGPGISANIRDKAGDTLLLVAAAKGHIDTFWLLLYSLADISTQERFIESMKKDATDGHVEIVFKIELAFVGTCDGARARKPAWFRNFGAEIEAFEGMYGSSGEVKLSLEDGSLCKAVELLLDVVENTDYVEYVESILGWKMAPGMGPGISVHVESRSGQPLLLVAAEKGHVEIVRLLLDRGVCVNTVGLQSQKALHLAAKHGHSETVRLLLERGAHVNSLNSFRETPLQSLWLSFPSSAVHGEVVQILIEYGAEVLPRMVPAVDTLLADFKK